MAARKPATISSARLATATKATVKAVLGKTPKLPERGTLAGFWFDPKKDPAGRDPFDVATEVALGTSKVLGVKLQPGVLRTGRGILVGFIRP